MALIARVALDVPLDRLFDYRIDAPAPVGSRVLVPFGNRKLIGVIAALASETAVAEAQLKSVQRVLDVAPLLSQRDFELLRFASDYYQYPLGATLLQALPPALKRVRPAAQRAALCGYSITSQAGSVDQLPARQTVLRRVLALLHAAPLSAQQVKALGRASRNALQQLEQRGWAARLEHSSAAALSVSAPSNAMPQFALTAEQHHAAAVITATLGGFAAWLLHGVTGSGKTEVYFEVIEQILARGEQALLLLPEINLTPQTQARFRARFPAEQLVSLHSDVSDAERAQRYLRAQRGEARLVIGTRSAVFTPLPKLGLIVVDEEHDSSFKQNDTLRYNARDLAVLRAQLAQVPVVLGSATPSLETYANAKSGRYRRVVLPARARPNTALPAVRMVSGEAADSVDGINRQLLAALELRVRRREQSLIFINRRGFAPVLSCAACRWSQACARCSANMVWHARRNALHCHYCGALRAAPKVCAACGHHELQLLGRGTQRVETVLQQHLPQARLLRVDRDSMSRKDTWNLTLDKIHAGELDILVGTQMLAKGHDFGNLTLVGMLDVDQALFSADFRAAERLYAQIVQVAGRAGRGERAGEVLIQTRFPDHPLFAAALRNDFDAFADEQLQLREAAGFPPCVHQALLRAEATDARVLTQFMQRAAQLAAAIKPAVRLYDPVEPAIARIAGKHRQQLLLQANARARLQRFLGALRQQLQGEKMAKVRWSIDVDPYEV